MTSTRRASSAESLTPAWTVWEVWAGVWAWQPNTATVTINARQRSGLKPLSTVSIISREGPVYGVGTGWAQRCVRLFRRHLPDVAAYFFKDNHPLRSRSLLQPGWPCGGLPAWPDLPSHPGLCCAWAWKSSNNIDPNWQQLLIKIGNHQGDEEKARG